MRRLDGFDPSGNPGIHRTAPQSLAELRKIANEKHHAVLASEASAWHRRREAGEALLKIKERTDRGKWGAWLDASFEGDRTAARLYMRVAAHWPDVEALLDRQGGATWRDVLAVLGGDDEKDSDPSEGGDLRERALAIETPAGEQIRPTVPPLSPHRSGKVCNRNSHQQQQERPTMDPAGQLVPDLLRDAIFDSTFAKAIEDLDKIADNLGQTQLAALGRKLSWYPYLDMGVVREYAEEVKQNFHDMLECIRTAMPTHVCPVCKGTGKQAFDVPCEGCRLQAGHVPTWRYHEILKVHGIEAP